MASRGFTDRDGQRWDIRVRSSVEWEFEPTEDNPGGHRFVRAPSHERDPYELSVEELQKLLDSAPPPRPRSARNPFLD